MTQSDWEALKGAGKALLGAAGDAQLLDNFHFDLSNPAGEFRKLISLIECSFLQRFLIDLEALPEASKKSYTDQETGYDAIFQQVADFKVLTNAVELLSELTGQGSDPNGSPLSQSLENINTNLSGISKATENLSSIKANTDLIPSVKEKTDLIDGIKTNTEKIPGIEGTVSDLPTSLATTVEADVSSFSQSLHNEYTKIINDYQASIKGDMDTHLKSMADARDTVVGYYRDLKADIVKNNDSLEKLFGDLSKVKDEITLKQTDRNTLINQAKAALEVAQHIDGIMGETVNNLTLLYNNALKKVSDAAGVEIEMTQMYKSLETYTDKIASAQELVIKSLDAVNQLAGVSGNLNQATTEILKSSGSIKEMQTVIDQVAENTQKNVQILTEAMTKINESSVKAIETFNNNLITLSNNFLKMKEVEDANNRSDKRIDQVIEGVKALTDVADSINGANGVNAMHSANIIESRKWH